jgi:hypothetical protein
MGVSNALGAEITFRAGRVEQSNFNDYPVTRIDAASRDTASADTRSASRHGRVGVDFALTNGVTAAPKDASRVSGDPTMKKACIAAGLALALNAVAFADTPIGPGVTGSGGTGKDAADTKLHAGAGGEAPLMREDGMPADEADANVSRTPGREDSQPGIRGRRGAAGKSG